MTESPKRPTLGYDPALDGIRAISVLAVLVYHAELGWLPGGFLGVDVFFVLSGYLITTLLLLERDAGRIGLVAFWGRRARRLFPALILTCLGVSLYAEFAARPDERVWIRDDGFASLFYVANWWFVFAERSYFEQFGSPSPFRHMWSLGIEEQWYLVWPLVVSVVGGAVAVARARIAAGVALAAAASAVWMAWLYDPLVDPSRVYFGTDTRAQALLVGSALAFARAAGGLRDSRLPALAGVAGAGVLAAMFVAVDDIDAWMYRGGYLLAAVASAAVVALCVASPAHALRRLLSVAPLVAVGKISYGLYLYHWPVYTWLWPGRIEWTEPALALLRWTVTFAVAGASYVLVERPVRERRLPRRVEPAVFVVAVAVAAGALFVSTREQGVERARQWEAQQVYAGRAGDRSLLVVGDSVAGSLAEVFRPDLVGGGYSVHGMGAHGCGVLMGRAAPPGEPLGLPRCQGWKAAWREAVATVRPDLALIVVGAWEKYDWDTGDGLLVVGTDAWRRHLTAQLDEAASIAASTGARVAALSPPCSATTKKYHERFLALDAAFRDWVGGRDDVAFIDLHPLLCRNAVYRTDIDGVRIYRDGVHFTDAGGATVWRWLGPHIDAAMPD